MRCRCTSTRKPAGPVSAIVEDAANEADARKKFAAQYHIEEGTAIDVSSLEPTQSAVPAAKEPEVDVDSLPASAEEAITQEVGRYGSPGVAVAEEPGEFGAGVSVAELKPFGVSDNDVRDMQKAGLETIANVVTYVKQHGGLTGVQGIGPVGQDKIRNAIVAYRAGQN